MKEDYLIREENHNCGRKGRKLELGQKGSWPGTKEGKY